jgi:hypothetical protein
MQIISKMLEGEEVTTEGLPEDLNIDAIIFFKYANHICGSGKKFFKLQNSIIGQSAIFPFRKY